MPLDPQTLVEHFNKFKPVQGPAGNIVSDILEVPGTNEIYIEPRSGANRREVTQLAVALAKARPDAQVEYDFSGKYYPVSANDTASEVYLRHVSDRPAGNIVGINGEAGGVLTGAVSTTQTVNLYDALIDAIRLSRENDGKTVQFAFGQFTMTVNGTSDADMFEDAVPKIARTLNAPKPQPPAPRRQPPRQDIGGGFSIG